MIDVSKVILPSVSNDFSISFEMSMTSSISLFHLNEYTHIYLSSESYTLWLPQTRWLREGVGRTWTMRDAHNY